VDSETPDQELVTASKQGDRNAYAILSQRYRERWARCAAMLIGDADEAESIAQEAITRAFDRLTTFRDGESFHAWVRGIVVNLCRQHLDRRRRQAKTIDPVALEPTVASGGQRQGVLSTILRRELSTKLWLAVAQLPAAYREAVVLHYVEGLDYDTISEMTGVAAGTLRVRALRGRNLLRGALGSVADTWLQKSPPESK
jgi:RNA polymerase sigma-70 factor, ECF subfamily